MNNIIAVTMGDPAGIGPEIIIKSLVEGELSGAPVVVVGYCPNAASYPVIKCHAASGTPGYRQRNPGAIRPRCYQRD